MTWTTTSIAFLALWSAGSGAESIRVMVTPRETASKPVSRSIYGHFIESGFGRQVDGMWSEMLFNRSFETLPPLKRGWLRYGPEVDLTKLPWWHSGYEESEWKLAPGNPDATFSLSPHSGFHHGKAGANLTNRSQTSPSALVQEGLHLRRGVAYRFRGFVRPGPGVKAPGELEVALRECHALGKAVASARAHLTARGWTEIAVDLSNPNYEGRAALSISVPPGAGVVLDDLSLMPADNIEGWRRDAVEELRKTRPSIIRFPGGCFATFYHWRDGVGPRSERKPQESDFWGGLEYNDVGTDDFIRLCRLVGAEPFPVINMMSGSPGEAADWVAYCNAPVTHPLGRLRAANGHPAPYGVKYWEMDNETYRKWSTAEYARECVRFSKAMKAIDPAIQLVAVSYGPFAQTAAELLEIAGRDLDLLSDRAKGERHLRRKLGLLRDYGQRTGRSIRLANTEWLAPWTDVEPDSDEPGGVLLRKQDQTLPVAERIPLQEKQISWRYALNAASTLLMFQRLGGDFEFANFNNLANTWGQNIIECPREPSFLSAAGRVFELFTASPAAWPLELEGFQRGRGLDAQAAWSAGRESLVLCAINHRPSALRFEFDLGALAVNPATAEMVRLQADSWMAHNRSANRNAIRRTEERLDLPGQRVVTVAAPPYSLTHVVLRSR